MRRGPDARGCSLGNAAADTVHPDPSGPTVPEPSLNLPARCHCAPVPGS